MSTRTIVEINHDHLSSLLGLDSYVIPRLLVDMAGCDLGVEERAFLASRGVCVLGQRHHSEPEWEQGKPAPR